MGQLFNDLALALAGSRQGGPAKVAVISSGLWAVSMAQPLLTLLVQVLLPSL